VVGSWDLPEVSVRGQRVDTARVADGNITVDFTVDEKDWDFGSCSGIFGRDLIHVEVIFPASAEECDFDQRTEQAAS
jgi:hypothetical protein